MNLEVRKIEKILLVGTGLTALVYSLFFFSNVISSSLVARGTGQNDWTVPTNPQSMIALCLVVAAVALWFLRERGALFAGPLYLAVMAFFMYWGWLTWGIRENMGVQHIPRTGPISNYWIGATWLDVLVFMATLVFLTLSAALAVKKLRARQLPQARSGELAHLT